MIARRYHRWIAVVATIFALWISTTGVITQGMDIGALLRHAPASDPTMLGIRAGIYGPPNFRVIGEDDFAGPALPAAFDYAGAFKTVEAGGRRIVGGRPLSYVELRQTPAGPIGEIASDGRRWRVDTLTGARLSGPSAVFFHPVSTPSLRNSFKDFHRLRAFGSWFLALDTVAGLLIIAMIVFGLMLYWSLYKARLRIKRPQPFWTGGGWWRTLHRGTSLVAAMFLLVIVGSGTLLTISALGSILYSAQHGGKREGVTADQSAPLDEGDLDRITGTTLAAFRRDHGATPIKVIRLRYYATMAQGVVVADPGNGTDQFVYDAHTGNRASLTEPVYPSTGQTWGWQAEETLKKIHRGDYFGMPGRWIGLLSGLALLYMSISGGWLYLDLLKRRRKMKRKGLFWK